MNYVTFTVHGDWLRQLDTLVIDLEKRNVFNEDVIFQHTYELFHFFLRYICTYLAKLLHAWIPNGLSSVGKLFKDQVHIKQSYAI